MSLDRLTRRKIQHEKQKQIQQKRKKNRTRKVSSDASSPSAHLKRSPPDEFFLFQFLGGLGRFFKRVEQSIRKKEEKKNHQRKIKTSSNRVFSLYLFLRRGCQGGRGRGGFNGYFPPIGNIAAPIFSRNPAGSKKLWKIFGDDLASLRYSEEDSTPVGWRVQVRIWCHPLFGSGSSKILVAGEDPEQGQE